MKKELSLFIMCVGFGLNVQSQNDTIVVEKQSDTVAVAKQDKKDIIKKGISFGPLPVVAFDQDKGFQFGALLNLFDYGDGSYYPHPRQQWYIEASAYTKGTQQYFLSYDTKHLIPHVRMSLAATCVYDKAMDFYGYNGYQAIYYYDSVNYWNDLRKKQKKQTDKIDIPSEYMSAFYRLERLAFSAKADFVGNIWKKKLYWEASYYFSYYKYNSIDIAKINKGKDSVEMFSGQTLYEKYIDWGIISKDEQKGGFTSALRLGLLYDTRDFEASPTRGFWAEANITLAPRFLGTTHQYFKYSATFRHYVPVVKNHLTFAYRIHYNGTFGGYIPYYIMPVVSTIGKEYDRDGIGGYRTVRGILRDRVQGLDIAYCNLEFRWKFVQFTLWKQNIYLGINAFGDAAIVTRNYDVSFRGEDIMRREYSKYISFYDYDALHIAAGGGFRIAINQNFIIAIDYAKPLKKQDGNGSLYINTGFLF